MNIWFWQAVAGVTKLIWPDCDDMWLLSGKPILRLVLAELSNGHRRPKSGNAFNWISLQGQLDTRSVLSAYVTKSGLQSTYLQTFGENGKCMFLRQEMAFAKSCPRFLWIPVHRCTQLMPQSCLKTQNLTKVSTKSNLQYGHSLGPWTWLESNAAPLWNEMNCPLSHDPPDYCTTENAEYIFLGCWLCIW